MKLILLIFSLAFPAWLHAQSIYPTPQKIENQGQIHFSGINTQNKIFADFYGAKGLGYKEIKDQKITAEGYRLIISKDRIVLSFATERGKFYAQKSLLQLLAQAKKSGSLPLIKINDQPDIAFRGTVEGFYGQPWSYDDRVSQLKFYGDWKLNTYIYGPKDDPYHSSPKWREAYPQADADMLKALVNIAKQNEVDFYWAIHPGKDINWNKQDSIAVLQKFEMMYVLGIRHFAVFFDDISGEGTKAEKQAGLLNYLQQEFVDKKGDVGHLIMCPTEYNKSWSNLKEGTYLDILGDALDKRIHIMWTGNSVIHDITKEGQEYVNKRIKRPSFVWWNFPVNDYVRNHLLLGSAYGLDQSAKAEMSGFVTNPMDKPEASKVAIFSVANYSWNLAAYKEAKTWQDAIEHVVPEIAKPYQLFSSHNTDPGPSYHQYRRVESANISATISFLQNQIIKGDLANVNQDSLSKLREEFAQFEPAVNNIRANNKNPKLIVEIDPWLRYFATLGKTSLALLTVIETTDLSSKYTHFKKFQEYRNQLIHIDQTENRNPYQPGIVSGSRYILPWIEQSHLHFHAELKKAGFDVPDATNQVKGKVYTNIAVLQALPVLNDVFNGNRPLQVLKLSRLLEVITLKKGDYLGLEVLSKSTIKEVIFKSKPAVKALMIQYSENGKDWTEKRTNQSRWVRVINPTDDVIAVNLEEFSVMFE